MTRSKSIALKDPGNSVSVSVSVFENVVGISLSDGTVNDCPFFIGGYRPGLFCFKSSHGAHANRSSAITGYILEVEDD